MTTPDYAAFARTMYATFNGCDYDAAIARAAADLECVTFPFDRAQQGREGCRAFMMGWKTMAPDGEVEIVRQLPGPDGVANECIFRGTNPGPLTTPNGDLPPTGKPFAVPFCEIWRIRAGKLVSLHNYSDDLAVTAQLGLLPAAAVSD